MAAGDITSIKVTYRHTLSGGRNAAGNGANDKVLVVGEITGQYISTGLPMVDLGGASAFGVTNIDLLKLEAVTSGSTYSDSRALSVCSYDYVNHLIFYVIDEGAATPADPNDDSWVFEQKLTASDGSAGDSYGTAVAISGTLAAASCMLRLPKQL